MQTLINFIVALPSEGKPLIKSLGLRPCASAHGIKLYQRDNFRLAVSGIGKAASAAAVGYVAGSEPPDTHHIWLNVGIAGHAYLPQASTGIAHMITDQATGVSYYPSIAFRSPCESYALACFDKPTTTYADDAMCDMESSGFFTAASRFSTVEFIHCLKIVSDNSSTDINQLNRTTISGLIEKNLELIETVAGLLQGIATTHLTQPIALPLDGLLVRWHFTSTQQTQLRDLARRWALVRADHEWPGDGILGCASSREVIASLGTILDRVALNPRSSDGP